MVFLNKARAMMVESGYSLPFDVEPP